MQFATEFSLQPGVPFEVLPLGIKPPVIPLFVLLLGVMVAIPAWKDSWTEERAISSGPSGNLVHRHALE
jgi:hypothetical protein